MNWVIISNTIGTSPWAWLALPVALVLPLWHAHWRKQRKLAGKSGDIGEALSFLGMGVLYFLLAVILICVADQMVGNDWEMLPVYVFKAGIPIYLLFMLFRQMIDAYF